MNSMGLVAGDAGQVIIVSKWRITLSQVLATTAKSMLTFNIGAVMLFVSLAIVGMHNAETGVSMNDEEVSWFAGLLSFCNPVGSLFSGLLLEYIGCKRSMMILSIPFTAVWLGFYFGQSSGVMFAAIITAGLLFGLAEAPCKSYAGEISQPALRGSLILYSCMFIFLGVLVPSAMGPFIPWRSVAAWCTVIPLSAFIFISMIPESPMRLVSRGQLQEAQNALCWLRGWVHPSVVADELQELIRYNEEDQMKRRKAQHRTDIGQGKSGSTVMASLRMLLERDTIRPLLLVVALQFLSLCACGSPLSVFSVQILIEMEVPLGPFWTMFVGTILALVTTVFTSLVVPQLGKRRIGLISYFASSLSLFSLGCYLRWRSWTPEITQAIIAFQSVSMSLGAIQLPWMLISEVFPYRTRGLASGISAAVGHLFMFVLSKLLLPVRNVVGLHGVYWLFSCIGFVGFVFIYHFLPETEGKSLQEIERLFNTKSRNEPISEGDTLLRECATRDVTL